MIIWIATISHREGTNGYVGVTPEDAKAKVYHYVGENWEQEGVPDELPADMDKAIKQYFEHVDDEYVEYSKADLAVEGGSVMTHIKLLRHALTRVLDHADSELTQRQTSGNDEEFAELRTDCERAHEALRATAIYEPASRPPASVVSDGGSENGC